MTSRKICVVTGTRAEYGLLRWVMQGIKDSPGLELQIVVTGMHLSPQFGLTYCEIEKDGFKIDRKVEMLLSSDTPVGITKSTGLGMLGFADAFHQLQPDIVLVLGDRFETFAAAFAAMVARIPIAHIHGGESTEGAIDEAMRHSITKMSHYHFVAAESYRQRVIQLGEHPNNVFHVGGLGVDNMKRLQLLERSALEQTLHLKFDEKNLLITFHPVTLEYATAADQFGELLSVLEKLEQTRLIFTYPNADTYGHAIIEMIDTFAAKHVFASAFKSLGQLNYLSCVQQVDGVIGNSSSGLLEVPSFCKGTINIGERQQGRLKAISVIDCEPKSGAIADAIQTLYSPMFQEKLKATSNPYGDGGASDKIIQHLQSISLKDVGIKRFYDL